MTYYIEMGAWPDDITDVTVNERPVAARELVTCPDGQVRLTWIRGGAHHAAAGEINWQARAMAWHDGDQPPAEISVTVRNRGTQLLEGRYRLRGSEIARWQPPAPNASENRWLIHPGAMTGDLWHIAAALCIDPNLGLVVVWNRNNEADDRNAEALLSLVEALGVPGERVIRASQALAAGGSLGNDQAREIGAERVLRKGRRAPMVGHTWASTSVVVRRALQDAGVRAAQDELCQLFDRAVARSPHFQEHKAAYDAHCLAWLATLQAGTRYVLVNMRWVGPRGQNPQHNITEGRYNQILARARAINAHRPTQLIKIGRPDVLDAANCGWAAGAAGVGGPPALATDIFADAPGAPAGLHEAIRENKLFQAYFWRQVATRAAAANATIHLIGGRSGGLDIASFLGIRSASWDRPAATDQHYMRLHWAAPYNSIIADYVGDRLDEGALEYWMTDHDLVPIVEGDPVSGATVGTVEEYLTSKPAYNALWYPPYPD